MGTVLACIGCYCCLFSVRPKFVELIALLANFVEIGFLIWGIVEIPFGDISTGGKVCFYITCGLIVLTFILLIILMVLRCSGKINTTANGAGVSLCVADLIFDVLAFIMIIISEAIILYKMWDLDEDVEYWRGRRYYYSNGYFSDSEWAAAIFSTSAGELGIIVHFYCMSFLLKLIQLKTNLSYHEYNENEANISNNSSGNALYSDNYSNGVVGTTINVYNQPPQNPNQLTFLGYDKDGHPIYSGNNQFRAINLPVGNQPYINQNINNVNNNVNNNLNNNTNDNTNNNANNNVNNKNVNDNNVNDNIK